MLLEEGVCYDQCIFLEKLLLVETVADFILGGSKITADGDCSHEIKRCLLLGRKVMTNPDSNFAFLHFFSMGMVLIPVSCTMSLTSFHSSLGTLSDLDP